jgi:hypothetical protein
MSEDGKNFEKFNAALDNLKNILSLKKITQDSIMQGNYSKAGDSLTLWNYDIIAWQSKVHSKDAEKNLTDFSKNYDIIINNKNNNLLKNHILKWYGEVMKYSYEIWFSKIETNPWEDMEAI